MRKTCCFLFVLLSLCMNVSAQVASELMTLEPDRSVEGVIAAEQTHRYKLALTAGQFIRVLVEQTGCDVALTLVAPDGKTAVESKLNRPNGLESLSYETLVSGEHLLQIRSATLSDNYPNPGAYQVQVGAFTGAYHLRLETRATATAQDRQRTEAERRLAETYHLGNQSAATLPQKEEKALQSLARWRALGDKYWEATTLNLLATAYYAANNYDKAAEWYAQALAVWRALGDRSNEARTLNDLGWAYQQARKLPQATECYEQALKLARAVKDRAIEADSIHNLARGEKAIEYLNQARSLCHALGDRLSEARILLRLAQHFSVNRNDEEALKFLQHALSIAREAREPLLEIPILYRFGLHLNLRGQNESSREYYEQALFLSRKLKHKRHEAYSLDRLGEVYGGLGQFEKAVIHFEQSLAIRREIKAKAAEAGVLSNLGYTHLLLGQYEKSLGLYEQSLALERELRNRGMEGFMLLQIGEVYLKLRQLAKARLFLEQGLTIVNELKLKQRQGEGLNLLGEVYRRQQQYELARDCFQQAVTIAQSLRHKLNEIGALLNFGALYNDQGQHAKAQEYLRQALASTRQIKDRFDEGLALHQLMLVNQSFAQPQLAVFYGKQSVNIWQEMRSDFRSLERESQQSFLKSREDTYRRLADLLISQGRLPEAEQVIHLLKEEEFFEFIRRDSVNAPQQQQAQLTPEEQALDKRYREIADQLAALGTERGTLLDKPARTPEEEQRLAKIEADLVVAGQAFQKFLDGLAQELGKNAEASNRVFQLREAQGLMGDLRDLGKGVVALYTLVGEEKYRVILTIADVQKAYEAPIKATELSRKILEFRTVLQNPKLDPLPLAQELYKILVAPVAKDLKAAKAETLMWSLDGVLRYVPMAALHDGEKFLVERFRNVVFTPASQARLKDVPNRTWRALGFGVTRGFGEKIPALPGVAEEMRGIIRDENSGAKTGVLPGTIKLDEQFTQEAMLTGLRQRPPVVHVASHFQFQPGNETNSALLLGDGQFLSLAQIKSLPNVFAGVDLLTLSACNTATGGAANGKEVEGFGVLAQRQGAKAVVASLWPVADRSTKNLMQEFYRLRESKAEVTKVEALRQAQIKLLRGDLQVIGERLAARSIIHEEDKTTNLPKFKVDPKAPYAHPYYWAPFILIGNWK